MRILYGTVKDLTKGDEASLQNSGKEKNEWSKIVPN